MSSRRRVSARVARRRALVADFACGVLLATFAMAIAAGIGVVGFGALIALLVMLGWAGIEGAIGRARRRPSARH